MTMKTTLSSSGSPVADTSKQPRVQTDVGRPRNQFAKAGSRIRIAVLAMNLFAVTCFGQLEIAPPLFVNVDATGLSPGTLTAIPNSGTLGGFFEARGGGTTVPLAAQVDGGGTVGIRFDGGDYLQ